MGGEFLLGGGEGDAGELEGFPGVGVAGDEGDVGGGDGEDFGEELDDGFVGFVVFGGLGDFDFEGVAEDAGEAGAAGVGDDFEVEEEGGAALFEIHDCVRQ